MNQKCGHPLAARQVSIIPTGLNLDRWKIATTCWACRVEKELRDKR